MDVPVCLTIHLLKDIQAISSFDLLWILSYFEFELLWIKLLWAFMYRFLYKWKFSFPWDKGPKVQLLGFMVVYVFLLMGPFHLSCQIYMYSIIGSILILLIPAGSPVSFLISIICIFFLFSLSGQLELGQFYWLFKESALYFIDFSLLFLFLLHWSLFIIIYFLLLVLDLFCSF